MVAEAEQSTMALAGKVTSGWLQRLSGYIVSLIRGPKEEDVGLSQDATDEKKELHALLSRDVVMRRGIIVIVIALGGFPGLGDICAPDRRRGCDGHGGGGYGAQDHPAP